MSIKWNKRPLAAFLALVLLLCLLCGCGGGKQTQTEQAGCTWEVSGNGVLTVRGSGTMFAEQVLPHAPWYERREEIRAAIVEDGVTDIGERAFAACGSLTEVSIPASVKYVSPDAFDGCTALTAITVDPQNASFYSENGVLFERTRKWMIAYPEGLARQNAERIPDAITAGEAPAPGTLDTADALAGQGARIMPLEKDGTFLNEVYKLMPEDVRTMRLSEADYVLVYAVRYRRMGSADPQETEELTEGMYCTVSSLYLCAPDGTYTELYSVQAEPPITGTGILLGVEIPAATLWEEYQSLLVPDKT